MTDPTGETMITRRNGPIDAGDATGEKIVPRCVSPPTRSSSQSLRVAANKSKPPRRG